jgi:hypothetical protein
MKKFLFALILMSSVYAVSAQATQDDILLIQAAYGKSKRDLMQEYMTFKDTASSNAFWKLYDSYEVDRKKIGQDYIKIIQQYANDYKTLDNKKADALMTKATANNLAYDKLYSTYYTKMKMAVGALKASQFLQIESYLHTQVKMSVWNEIPFIGEIDRSKLQVSTK